VSGEAVRGAPRTRPSHLVESVYGRFAPRGATPTVAGELMRCDRELVQANEELRQCLKRVEARNDDLEAFVHTVAHDLRGPAHNLVGYASFVQKAYDELDGDQVTKCLGIIQRNALRLSDILDELLLLCQVRHGEMERAPVEMSGIVEQALARLALRIADREARVVRPDAWPAAVGYGPWIEEVWVNYIDNAIKYGGDPPEVLLGAARHNGTTRFWVRDNGGGLPLEQQEQLFAPFKRLSQAQTQGHGLGLSIVRHIVEKLGGSVGVESGVGQGCTFYFTLPAEG